MPGTVWTEQTAPSMRGRWSDHFARQIGAAFDGRLTFEIGCFDAEYLTRLAARHPHSAFIGLDWKCKAIHDGAERIAAMNLRNVALIRGRAQDLREQFAVGELDEIWLFHPDPCDKPAELKNRLFARPFLLDAHAVLRQADSILAFKTDHPGYYQWVLSLLGLPEPAWFAAARSGAALAGGPKVRAKDLVDIATLPGHDPAIDGLFRVSCGAADFWRDESALARTADRYFAGEQTLFETRFTSKRQPIYYVELAKKA